MPPIQLRRGNAIGANDQMYVGEPMWDPDNSRFGVFNNRSNLMEWYPIVIGDKMLMNTAQLLGGLNSAGNENPVKFDWGTDGSLILKNTTTSQVYATFAAGGATFNAVSALGTSYVGLLNMVPNGNLAVKRNLLPITIRDTNAAGANSTLVAPNWNLWQKGGTSGRLLLQYDSSGSLPYVGCPNVFQISASNACANAGLRTFLHGYASLAGTAVVIDMWILGVAGAETYTRAITENGNTQYSDLVVATGSWQKVTKSITLDADGSDWMLLDVLYNPSHNTSNSQVWKFGGVQIRPGTGSSDFENRPAPFEAMLCASLYQEGKVYLQNNQDSEAVSFGSGLAYSQRIETKEENNAMVTVTGVTNQGFVINCPEISAATHVDFAAYVLPYTTDSTPA